MRSSRRSPAIWLAASLALWHCAGSARISRQGTVEPDTDLQSSRSGAPGENSVASIAPPGRPPGPATRAEIEALVARGLGTLLARMQLTPVLEQAHFVGFRLDGAQDLPEWRAAGADIRVGDVIQRVNGIRIERPEQALWAFERLRIADAIVVDVLRDGLPVTIRSPIVDTNSARRTGRLASAP